METTVKPKIFIAPELLTFSSVEEKLETSYGLRRITWTSADGRETDIKELTDDHVTNLLIFLVRHKLYKTNEIIAMEKEHRESDGHYPSEFDDIVDQYKQNPETWRLKIYE